MSQKVPSFPGFRPITLDDKELFTSHFSKAQKDLSEYTFTNFFMWRACDHAQMTLINGDLCVAAWPEDEAPYFFEPIAGERIEETIAVCLSHIPRFSRVSDDFVKKYFNDSQKYSVELDRDHCDYLYNKDDLVNLRGRKYDGKRNKIKKLLKSSIPVYRELKEDNIAGCLKLLDRWKKVKTSSLCFDAPIKESLANFSSLNIKGAVVLINGVVEAFTIGERSSHDTAIIYIEVANQEIDGLSQFINQQFCLREWADSKYINREQDLGDLGLRRAKLSYHPARLINKYNVTLID